MLRLLTFVLVTSVIVHAAHAQVLPPSALTAAEQALIVDAHNAERARFQIRPLEWVAALATYAQAHANFLAATGKNEHDPQAPNLGHGENIHRTVVK